jgi:LysR family transcriptional regulator, nitrogen assimilation regulatory protein
VSVAASVGIDDLKLFLAVASAGSFSRAATLAGTTQSAISKRMLVVERQLDCRLFERTGRGAQLTDAGRSLLPRAEHLVTEVARLVEDVASDVRRPRGHVRFAVQQSVSWPLVGDVVRRVGRELPEVHLEIFEAPMTQIDEWLREGRIDLAVVSRLPRDDAAAGDPLFARTMHLVAPRGDRLARQPTIPFSRLAGLPIIIASLSNAGRLLLEEEARRRGWNLAVIAEVNSIHLVKRLVAEGRGYWIGSRRTVAGEIASGTLAATRIVRPLVRQRFYLAHAGTREATSATRAVAGIVRDLARSEGEP